MAALNWILSAEDPGELVQSVSTPDLYFMMKDIGLADSHVLLELATIDQISGLLDIDLWTKHRLDLDRWRDWVNMARTHSVDTAMKVVKASEPELLQLLFMKDVKVHTQDLDLDTVPDTLRLVPSPDGVFWFTIPVEHPMADELHPLLKLLWATDMTLMRDISQTARFELLSSVEETLVRFREGRLAEMGFASPDESLGVYAYLKPTSSRQRVREELETLSGLPRVGEGLIAQDALIEVVEVSELLATVINAMDAETRERFAQGVTYLVNKVFMARTADLSQTDALPEVGQHVGALMNLGLLYLADESVERASKVVEKVWPEELFRVGHSLTLDLSKPARKISARAGRHLEMRLFGSPVDECLEGLCRRPPQLYEGLVDPAKMTWRDVGDLSELSRLSVIIEDAHHVLSFFEDQLGFSPDALRAHTFTKVSEDAVEAIDFRTLFRTGLAQTLLCDAFSFQPLTRSEFATFLQTAYTVNGDVVAQSAVMMRVLEDLTAQVDPQVARWIEQTVDDLGLALGRVQAYDLDPSFTAGLILTEGS